MKILCIGDVMIPGEQFRQACREITLKDIKVLATDWETDWDKLQNRRLVIEKQGPEAEPILPQILSADKDAEMLLVLFAPVSAGAMDALPRLRLVGAARAGLENVDLKAATERGIIVHNIMGRNAHAVSDFAIGLLFAEARNIARAHHAVKSGTWQKTFPNSDVIPEITGKTLGIIGFGYIGQLVAKKLSGYDLTVLVYDPYVPDAVLAQAGAVKVSKEELFSRADFISIHARLTDENKGMIGRAEIGLMKPTAILINTGRAGLVDEDALFEALREKRIAGAAMDVFWTEPLPDGSRWRELDNVTLTTHIAGTTADALKNSPYLLTRDINALVTGGEPRFIANREVLDRPEVKAWLDSLKS